MAVRGADGLLYQDFEKFFIWPKLVGSEWETKCIRAIRDWMFKSSLSAETAFQVLISRAGKDVTKKLSRPDFHLAVADLKFTAPEADGLFKVLDTK